MISAVALVRRPGKRLTTKPTYKRALQPARLYANDLDALLRYLSEDGRSVQLRAGAGDSVLLDNADDLCELTPRERGDLRIKVIDPPVEVRLSNETSWATTSAVDSDAARNLVDGTARLIGQWATGAARFDWKSLAGLILFVGVPSLILLGAIVVWGKGWSVGPLLALGSPVVFVTLVWMLQALKVAKHRVVVSSRTRDAANARRSHAWETVLVAAIGGVAGSVSTWLLALKP